MTNNFPGQDSTTTGIYDDLLKNGYIGANGKILAKASALTDISQLALAEQYGRYRVMLYDTLMRTVRSDQVLRSSFLADYNFVAGAASAGFPPKRNSACDPAKTYTEANFCEPHGINGGDPRLQNLANPLGADGIPFTLDDGLKPLSNSPLCARGEGGLDIGAYSCSPTNVFVHPARPAPANPRILR